MDYDLWLKIAAYTRNWMRVPEVLAFYRWHAGGQISAAKWRQAPNFLEVWRRFVANHPKLYRHLDRAAYQALWQHDLLAAHRLFCWALRQGGWQAKDLKYLIASLRPFPWHRLVGT